MSCDNAGQAFISSNKTITVKKVKAILHITDGLKEGLYNLNCIRQLKGNDFF